MGHDTTYILKEPLLLLFMDYKGIELSKGGRVTDSAIAIDGTNWTHSGEGQKC